MSEEEIEQLIPRLRALLLEHGFGWAIDQAEAALNTGVRPVRVARALIDAAEAVTIDLAAIELQATNKLRVEE